MVSVDRGASWAKVPGSERATYVTSIDWLRPGNAMVSTYGRGLWTMVRTFRLPPIFRYCRLPCWLRVFPWGDDDPLVIIDPLWDPVPERLQRSLVVIDGRILGARTEGARLTELTITPGAELAWRGRGNPPPFTLKTANRWQGLPFPKLSAAMAQGEPIVGIAFGRNDQPIGVIRSNRLVSPAVLPEPKPRPVRPERPNPEEVTQSPYASLPVVEIVGAGASNRVVAGSPIVVRARNIRARDLVVLRIDGQIAARGKPTANGEVVLQARAPIEKGIHTITVGEVDGPVLAGANVLVVHEDERDRRQQPPVR
jgi:hypothetical protein